MQKKFYISDEEDSKVGGVCGGIAEYFDIEPLWVRLGFVLLSLFPAPNPLFIVVYCVLYLLADYKPEDKGGE